MDVALSAEQDSSRIAALISQIGGLRKEQEMLTAQHLRHVRSVLSPPHADKMDTLLEKFFNQQNK